MASLIHISLFCSRLFMKQISQANVNNFENTTGFSKPFRLIFLNALELFAIHIAVVCIPIKLLLIWICGWKNL